jgi:hypothetical protein
MWAEMCAAISGRIAPVGAVVAAAADSDPAAAQLLADYSRHRLIGAAQFIRQLASKGDGLAPGVTEQQATDLCWSLMDGSMYGKLVRERGWPHEQFTRWLYQSLAAVLLPPRPAP